MPPVWIRWAVALLALGSVVIVVVATSGSSSSSSSERSEGHAPEPHGARSEYSNIYFIDVANPTLDQVTNNVEEQFADAPAWSRKGRIAFSETPCEPCPARLFATDARGSESKRIPSDVTNLFQPSWSPDGKQIAAAKPGSGIYVISLRDGDARRLSTGEADEAPAWSPDSDLILFHRQVTATNWDIYAVRPSGGPLRRITRSPLQQLHPTWSPRGTRVAFTEQQRNGNWVIYTMRLDGSGRRRVTDARDSSQAPSWSPRGERIVFISQVAGDEAIAVINVDGTGRENLTDSSLAVTAPSWSPDGRKVVFAAKDVSGEAAAH